MRGRPRDLRHTAETALDLLLFGGGIVMLAAAGIAIGTVGAVVKGGLEAAAETEAFVDRMQAAGPGWRRRKAWMRPDGRRDRLTAVETTDRPCADAPPNILYGPVADTPLDAGRPSHPPGVPGDVGDATETTAASPGRVIALAVLAGGLFLIGPALAIFVMALIVIVALLFRRR